MKAFIQSACVLGVIFSSPLFSDRIPPEELEELSEEKIEEHESKKDDSVGDKVEEEELTPWFTGPLFTGSGYVVPGGHVNIQPYFFYKKNVGIRDSNGKAVSGPSPSSVIFDLSVQIGMTEFMNVQLIPGFVHSWDKGESATEFKDLPYNLEIQLYQEHEKSWLPTVKLLGKGIIPTGNYQRLNPLKNGLDQSGRGSFAVGPGIILSKLFYLYDIHFINVRFATSYLFYLPTDVKGVSAYGGGVDAIGRVNPGNQFQTSVGLEYSLTQNWALALDIIADVGRRSKFSGDPGTNGDGTPASAGTPSWEQISLAPAIEYNFSSELGIIGGVWFDVWGRNTSRFVSGVISLTYFF